MSYNQYKLRKYSKIDFSKIDEWKIGYLAGIIDGEGSIILPKDGNWRRSRVAYGSLLENQLLGDLHTCALR